MILGQVVAESIAKRRPPAGPLPSFDVPAPSPEVLTALPPATTAPIDALPRTSTIGVLPGTVKAGRLPSVTGTSGDAAAAPASTEPGPTPPPATVDSRGPEQFGLGPAAAAAPSDRVRSGYGSFILAALAGAALFLARQRTRLA